MLELIDKGQVTEQHPVPLLFVHGACHGAWCWDDHFLDYFAGRGFRATAVSLRGHGASGSTTPLYRMSMSDYVHDVHTAIETIGTAPVLIGHSMGGFILQHYLGRFDAPAAVLLGSVPPVVGMKNGAKRLWRRHPLIALRSNMFGRSHEVFSRRAREALFSAATPSDVIDATVARLGPESRRALFVDVNFRLPNPGSVSTPLLILGAEEDGSVTVDEVHLTARAYNTEATIFPRMGHNMMQDVGWDTVAEHIGRWLEGRGL